MLPSHRRLVFLTDITSATLMKTYTLIILASSLKMKHEHTFRTNKNWVVW